MQQSRFDRWLVIAVVIVFVLAVIALTSLAGSRKKPRIRPSWSEPARTVPTVPSPSPIPPQEPPDLPSPQ